jgi:RND family efflux transporter MFP subunit
MKKKKKLIIIILSVAFLLIVLITVILIFALKGENVREKYITQTVERGEINKTVSETATLISDSPVNLNFEIGGKLEEIRVEEGQMVNANEILAILDKYQLNLELKKAEIALEEAQALAGANDDSIREAKVRVENLEDLEDKTQDLEEQRVDQAEENYKRALDYEKAMKDYYDSFPDKTKTEAKLAYTQYLSAKNQSLSLEEVYQTVKDQREYNLQLAENNLKEAEARLETLESEYTQTSNDSYVKTAKANYELALSQLEKSTLKAPLRGKITQLNYEKGEVVNSMGAGRAFLELMSEELILEADVPESDIVEVELGQSAYVEFDSLDSSELVKATVIEIAPASTVISDVVYFKVKLKLEAPDSRLKPGMSADVDIQISGKENALVISKRALIEKEDGTQTVKLIDSKGKIKEVTVRTGLSGDEGLIEIKSGLNAGDQIILQEKGNVLDL